MIQMHEFNEFMEYIRQRDAERDRKQEERFTRFKEEVLEAVSGREESKEWYTTRELGEVLGVSGETVRKNYIGKGLVKSTQVSSRTHRISREEFLRVKQRHDFMKGVL